MPSALTRKMGNSKKPRISRQQNFRPAFKAVRSLVDDIGDAEDPEDYDIKSKIVQGTSLSLTSKSTCSTSASQGHGNTSNRFQTISPDTFFNRNGLLDDFESESDSEDGSSEDQSETRTLTEVERLEEVQTALEEKIKQAEELLQRTDRTRNQRRHCQQRLRRLELKLEKLEQRLQRERKGKSQWTYVRKVLKKPKVGFHSSELLNRKVPLGMLAASLEARPHLSDVVLAEMARNAETVQVEEPPKKPDKIFKSKALHEFQLSLSEEGKEESKEKEEEENASENAADRGWLLMGNGEAQGLHDPLKDEVEQLRDRKEMNKGWLRISDRPADFVKRIQDASDTKQSKEAWVNISDQGRHLFARKVFRANVDGDSLLSRSLDRKRSALNVRGEKVSIDGRRSVNSSQVKPLDSKNRAKVSKVGRVSSSQLPRTKKVVKIESVPGTTSFLPPIPKSEAKKRPKQEQLEKMKDENDKEQKQERLLLIPNKKRLAKRRMEVYLKQLEFAKSYRLDQKEIIENMAYAVDDFCCEEEEPSDHEAKTTPRNTLYLIGALSRDHLRPPTAP